MIYTDHDPSITVELTGPEKDYCLRVTLDGTRFLLHVRSAVDLSQKLQKAVLDWITVNKLLEIRDRK